jgi:hypothetical protein
MGGVASFLITMRPHLAVLEPGHFAGFSRWVERFQGVADFPGSGPNQSAISWRIQHHA